MRYASEAMKDTIVVEASMGRNGQRDTLTTVGFRSEISSTGEIGKKN